MNNSFANTARLLSAALRALLVLTVLTGILYPLASQVWRRRSSPPRRTAPR